MKKIILLLCVCMLYVSAIHGQQALAANTTVNNDVKKNTALIVNLPDSEFQQYIANTRDEIADNDKRIASLMNKLVSVKSSGSKRMERIIRKQIKNIVILQLYNDEMKADLNNYETYGDGDWRLFKKEFNHDLDELNRDIAEMRQKLYEDFIALNGKDENGFFL